MRPEVDLQHQRDINALTRQTVIWTLASAAVGAVGVFSVILYFDPSLLQTPPNNGVTTKASKPG
jgi:hypothetical protein